MRDASNGNRVCRVLSCIITLKNPRLARIKIIYELISSIVRLEWCSIGVHLTLINTEQITASVYSNTYKGNKSEYHKRLIFGHFIRFRSVIITQNDIKNSITYPEIKPTMSPDANILKSNKPLDIKSIPTITFATIETSDTIAAGIIENKISAQEKNFLEKSPLNNFPKYLK